MNKEEDHLFIIKEWDGHGKMEIPLLCGEKSDTCFTERLKLFGFTADNVIEEWCSFDPQGNVYNKEDCYVIFLPGHNFYDHFYCFGIKKTLEAVKLVMETYLICGKARVFHTED